MGHVIVKQVTRPDYGMTPGETFPYEHEFAEPVHWAYAIVDDPAAPPYRTPAPQAVPETKAQAGTARGQAKGAGAG